MPFQEDKIRVLHSFPHKLGAGRICTIAWHQMDGVALAGAEVKVFTGCSIRPLPHEIIVHTTLGWKKLRIPYRFLGTMRACALHDYIVSKRVEKLAGQIDIIHTWPLGAKRTLEAARKLRIPTVLERPNAHTRFAYEVVQTECDRIGVPLPPGHEHKFDKNILAKEEQEYRLADVLLCPSDFVVQTFRDRGFPPEKLKRHIYGFDERKFFPGPEANQSRRGLIMISVGVCAVRKGLHFALEAWLNSPASQEGTFLIAGEFIPAYKKKLEPMLAHPSVRVLGHRNDVAELMRKSDILVLPSIEEGFGLVVAEAMGSGCVPLISNACTDICKHMVNGLVHPVGNVEILTQHITLMHQDRELLRKLRATALRTVPEITWTAAGVKLLEAYQSILSQVKSGI